MPAAENLRLISRITKMMFLGSVHVTKTVTDLLPNELNYSKTEHYKTAP